MSKRKPYIEENGSFYCPLWSSEECDWECPNGGMAPDLEESVNGKFQDYLCIGGECDAEEGESK